MNGLLTEGGTSKFSGGELQVAHDVSNSFGLMINGFAASHSAQVSSWDIVGPIETRTEKGSGSYVEFARGYFKTLDKSKKLVFETYGGLGFGGVNNDYGPAGHPKVNDTKLFVQPSFGYKSIHFELAFVPKLSFVSWKVKDSSVHASDHYVSGRLGAIRNQSHFMAIEPAFILRAGGRKVKFQTALSFLHPLSNTSSIIGDMTEDLNISFGLSINLTKAK